MADDSFDAIVVGAGLAGSAAAYTMAQAGREVLLVERATAPGAKSMSGGRIYAYSLAKLWPDFAQSAPLQRKVVRETVSMVQGRNLADFSLFAPDTDGNESYTVLRQEFDNWAAGQAVRAGANLICSISADSLFIKNNQVAGIMAGGESVEAKVVILAEGANGILARAAGLRAEYTPQQVAIGFKEIIELPEEIINQRFNLQTGQGAARLMAGSMTDSLATSGAFLYTNKNSLSLGMVISVASAARSRVPVHELLENFKCHPAIAPLLQGGKTVEYSAHMVPEGWDRKIQLCADNLMLAGDVASMVINHGFTVRGMDLALLAGQAAGRAVLACNGRYDAKTLGAAYQRSLTENNVITQLKAYRHMPEFLANPRLTRDYPKLAVDIFKDVFRFDNSPPRRLMGKILPRLLKVGPLNLLKDAWSARRAL